MTMAYSSERRKRDYKNLTIIWRIREETERKAIIAYAMEILQVDSDKTTAVGRRERVTSDSYATVHLWKF